MNQSQIAGPGVLIKDPETGRTLFVFHRTDDGRCYWVMPEEWMGGTDVGVLVGRVTRRGEPLGRQAVNGLAHRGKISYISTPLGKMYHVDDVADYIRRNYRLKGLTADGKPRTRRKGYVPEHDSIDTWRDLAGEDPAGHRGSSPPPEHAGRDKPDGTVAE